MEKLQVNELAAVEYLAEQLMEQKMTSGCDD
jgi:hypothetical protein